MVKEVFCLIVEFFIELININDKQLICKNELCTFDFKLSAQADLVQHAVIRNCRAEGLLMLVHLAIFRVTRQASAPKRQLRIPPPLWVIAGKNRFEKLNNQK
jgi:hypothetical protein